MHHPFQLLRTTLPMGRILGIPVRLHWSWLPAFGLMVWVMAHLYSFWGWAAGDVVGLFVLVLLHELGHSLVARRLGVEPKYVVIWPLGGFAVLDTDTQWKKELPISAAGPAVNLLLLPLLYLLRLGLWTHVNEDANTLLWHFLLWDLGLIVFNLLPIWPLDGGRILNAILEGFLGKVRGKLVGAIVGLAVASVAMPLALFMFDVLGAGLLLLMLLSQVRLLRWPLYIRHCEKAYGFHAKARCPSCGERAVMVPNSGDYYCGHCGVQHDVFEGSACWNCGMEGGYAKCEYCGHHCDAHEWIPQTGK